MKFKKITQFVLILMLAAGFTACSDNGSSAEEENQQPAIPELAANAQPDITFFQNNEPTAAKGAANATVQNFNTAKGVATGGAGFLSIGQSYSAFINPAADLNADFTDGQWVWEYNASQNGQSGSIRTTARPQDDGFSWETFVSYNDGEGNSLSDFKLMDGTTSNNGDQGSWRFFSFTDDENNSFPILSSSWTVISETERNTELQIFDENGENAGTVSYVRDGAENTMTLDLSDDSEQAEVFWDTDTNEGYVKQDGETTCWGSDFQDVKCS